MIGTSGCNGLQSEKLRQGTSQPKPIYAMLALTNKSKALESQ